MRWCSIVKIFSFINKTDRWQPTPTNLRIGIRFSKRLNFIVPFRHYLRLSFYNWTLGQPLTTFPTDRQLILDDLTISRLDRPGFWWTQQLTMLMLQTTNRTPATSTWHFVFSCMLFIREASWCYLSGIQRSRSSSLSWLWLKNNKNSLFEDKFQKVKVIANTS